MKQHFVGGKTKPLSAHPLGAPWLWAILVALLFVWSAINGYAVWRVAFTFAGVVLAAAVQLMDEDRRRVTANRIREALRLADIPFGAAAFYMYGDEKHAPNLSKALNGERPLDLWRLDRLPDEFQRHYATLVLIEKGAPSYIRQALKMFLPEVLA